MRQVRVTRGPRWRNPARRAELLEALPLDPRDPEIVRAKRLQRSRGYS
jgi:hypothetical protein